MDEEISILIDLCCAELRSAVGTASRADIDATLLSHVALIYRHVCRLTGSIDSAERAERDLLAKVRALDNEIN